MAPPSGKARSADVGKLRPTNMSTGASVTTLTTAITTRSPPAVIILECPCCEREFSLQIRRPQVLSCGHTVCELCSTTGRHRETCDSPEHDVISENLILLQLLGERRENSEDIDYFISMAYRQICSLASLLRPSPNAHAAVLSRPMLRKLLAFVNSNLEEPFGLHKALKAARSLAERSLVEVILEQQSSGQLTASLWAAVRARGCQFLGPAMQEEVLKLVLLALEDGSALSRKVLVMFVVQRLSTLFPHASKTSIGHVVQLLYRASCFVVAKRDGDSSLMQLKEEFRTYESLRREHDAQIVSIACEAGLRIAPEQWSSLLYGDGTHRSHMQSIIDRLQAPQSLEQTTRELSSLATRANHLPLASLLQLLQQPLKILEWQPDEVASSGGKAVFDFISAAVSTVHCCLSLLQQQQQQGSGPKINGLPSPISASHPFQQQPSQQQQHHSTRSTNMNCSTINNNNNSTANCNVCSSSSSSSSGGGNNNGHNVDEHLYNGSSNNGITPAVSPLHPSPYPAYKYKVNLCRDMNHFGVCPRGVVCTFAHSIREQEHFRTRGKQHSRPQQQQLHLTPSQQPRHHQLQPQQIRPYHHQPPQHGQRYPAAVVATTTEQAAQQTPIIFHSLTEPPSPPSQPRHRQQHHHYHNHSHLQSPQSQLHSTEPAASDARRQVVDAIEATPH
ncbi:roquin-2-like isoform X3 [Varroa destructor]|nr:roquin-2-like isoform X3 [Varroa destructor]